MIDFHTNTLPGINDGAGFVSDSPEIARMALEDGVTGVVLTPPPPAGQVQQQQEKGFAGTGSLKKRPQRRQK